MAAKVLEEPTESAVPPTYEPLNMSSRCCASSSGAEQAFTRWVKDGQELLFCSHHHDRYSLDLELKGFKVETDNRSFINTKPSPSASTEAEIQGAD